MPYDETLSQENQEQAAPAPQPQAPAPRPSSPQEIRYIAVAPAPVNRTPKPFWRRLVWDGKVGPAFWTFTGLVSLVVNLILIIILIVMAQQIFTLKGLVQNQLIGGLYNNFQLMDDAHIRTTIPVSTEVPAKFNLPLTGLTVPAKFDLPLKQETVVTLTQSVRINNATIYNLNAGALQISQAQLDIDLPQGTQLPVMLDLTVPVDQTIPLDSVVVPVDQMIPVKLMVNVDIPLRDTELHQPFVGLQDVVKPYYTLLSDLPNSWQAAVCSLPFGMCGK